MTLPEELVVRLEDDYYKNIMAYREQGLRSFSKYVQWRLERDLKKADG